MFTDGPTAEDLVREVAWQQAQARADRMGQAAPLSEARWVCRRCDQVYANVKEVLDCWENHPGEER